MSLHDILPSIRPKFSVSVRNIVVNSDVILEEMSFAILVLSVLKLEFIVSIAVATSALKLIKNLTKFPSYFIATALVQRT